MKIRRKPKRVVWFSNTHQKDAIFKTPVTRCENLAFQAEHHGIKEKGKYVLAYGVFFIIFTGAEWHRADIFAAWASIWTPISLSLRGPHGTKPKLHPQSRLRKFLNSFFSHISTGACYIIFPMFVRFTWQPFIRNTNIPFHPFIGTLLQLIKGK